MPAPPAPELEGSRAVGSVEAAVLIDLSRLTGAGAEGLRATALVLARRLDDPRTAATAFSMCAARLLEALDRLRLLAPPEQEIDDIDELNARRAARLREAGA